MPGCVYVFLNPPRLLGATPTMKFVVGAVRKPPRRVDFSGKKVRDIMQKKPWSRWNTAVWGAALVTAVFLCACSSMEEKRDKFLASGEALYQQGDYVRARLQFQNALQIDPKFAAAFLWLGKTELKLQNPRGAYGALNKAVELNPQLTEAYILLGDILLLGKQLDKAQEQAEIALKQEPQNTD